MCHYSNRTKTERNREMAASKELIEAFPMKSGDGPNSYAKNSTYQVLLLILWSDECLSIQTMVQKRSNCYIIMTHSLWFCRDN